jgi:hypothetical protein
MGAGTNPSAASASCLPFYGLASLDNLTSFYVRGYYLCGKLARYVAPTQACNATCAKISPSTMYYLICDRLQHNRGISRQTPLRILASPDALEEPSYGLPNTAKSPVDRGVQALLPCCLRCACTCVRCFTELAACCRWVCP